MAYDASHLVLQLTGNPQTTSNPTVTSVTNADIHDAGDGWYGLDKSTAEMEEYGAIYTGSTSTYTINGVVYNMVAEVDTGSIDIDGQTVQGYFVSLQESDAGGSVILNSGSFFFPLGGEDVSFVVPGTSTVTATGQLDTHTPMVYADLAAPVTGVTCFTKGALIKTPSGGVPIEDLHVGHFVNTLDSGPQRIRWIGQRKVSATGSFSPIHFEKDAIGNPRAFSVSPQHRILISSPKAELLFAEQSVLVAAKHLVNNATIYIKSGGTVEYFHILFDKHEIVFADGIPSESFFPGKLAIESLNQQARDELFSIFPELQQNSPPIFRTAPYPTLYSYEAALL